MSDNGVSNCRSAQAPLYGPLNDDPCPWRMDQDGDSESSGSGFNPIAALYAADVLVGGSGNDTLQPEIEGGSGNDTLVFSPDEPLANRALLVLDKLLHPSKP